MDATIASIAQEEQAFEHQVHQYILANMAVVPNGDQGAGDACGACDGAPAAPAAPGGGGGGGGSNMASLPTSPGVGSAAVQAKLAEASAPPAPPGGDAAGAPPPPPSYQESLGPPPANMMPQVGILGMGAPPTDAYGGGGPSSELAMLRHKRATLQNKQAERHTIFLEQGQHNQEAAEVFPALNTRVQEEDKMWASEAAALAQESSPRLEERALYTAKVTAQEEPVDGVLGRQHSRMEAQLAMDAGLQARAGMRAAHFTAIGTVHTSISARNQPRAERNQIRDSMYGNASQRLQAQQGNPVRLFFCNDIGPVEVPADFENDVSVCKQMTMKNNEDLAALATDQELVRGHQADKVVDATVLVADTVGWYAYAERVNQAEAAAEGGTLAFLDREFLSRMGGKAAAIEQQTAAEGARLEALGATHSDEAGVVSDPTRTVGIDLEQLRQTLENERPAFDDEHARNHGIVSTIASEHAARAAKEAGLAAQLAGARNAVASTVGQLQEVQRQFMDVVNNGDVEVFLNIDGVCQHPKQELERVKEEKRNANQRPHNGHDHDPFKHHQHRDAENVLSNAMGVLNRVSNRVDRARRGESMLRAAIGMATVAGLPLGVALAQMSIPLHQPGAGVHQEDLWLAAHLANQRTASNALDAARQEASSNGSILARCVRRTAYARCYKHTGSIGHPVWKYCGLSFFQQLL